MMSYDLKEFLDLWEYESSYNEEDGFIEFYRNKETDETISTDEHYEWVEFLRNR